VRPWPEQNLSGWRIRSISFGNESFGICADSNKEPRRPWVEGCQSSPHVIMWGNAKYGEVCVLWEAHARVWILKGERRHLSKAVRSCLQIACKDY
jgi:hypothetical protein